MNYLNKVKEFHSLFNLPIGKKPKNLDRKQFSLRCRLLLEEFSEYCKAVGENDIVGIADALGDILWVVFGTAIEHGLPMDKIFEEIASSNISKVGGYEDKSGKWVKTKNYVPVNLNWLNSFVEKAE